MRSRLVTVTVVALLVSACSTSDSLDTAPSTQASASASIATPIASPTTSDTQSMTTAAASPAPSIAVSSSAPTSTARTSTGPTGQTLRASATQNLNANGAKITVRGTNFDESIGVYVALCVTPTPGQMPSPCGGGADMSASTGASAWISSNAPNYGEGLARPYEPGGDFEVTLSLSSRIGMIDCRTVSCSIVTRADHLRIQDRTADVVIPVSFR